MSLDYLNKKTYKTPIIKFLVQIQDYIPVYTFKHLSTKKHII